MQQNKMLSNKQLSNLGANDMEKFAQYLVKYGKIIKDFTNNSRNERKVYFTYKGWYFSFKRKNDDVIEIYTYYENIPETLIAFSNHPLQVVFN